MYEYSFRLLLVPCIVLIPRLLALPVPVPVHIPTLARTKSASIQNISHLSTQHSQLEDAHKFAAEAYHKSHDDFMINHSSIIDASHNARRDSIDGLQRRRYQNQEMGFREKERSLLKGMEEKRGGVLGVGGEWAGVHEALHGAEDHHEGKGWGSLEGSKVKGTSKEGKEFVNSRPWVKGHPQLQVKD